MDPVWLWGGLAVLVAIAAGWVWQRSGRSPAVGAPVKMRGYVPNMEPTNEATDAWDVIPVRTGTKKTESASLDETLPLGEDASVRDLDSAASYAVHRTRSSSEASDDDAVVRPLSSRRRRSARQEAAAPPAEALVVVLNVIAVGNARFAGTAIVELARGLHLEFGRRGIFHCPDADDLSATPLFSMVNAVEPGTFDMQNITTVSTPGLCFILQLPGPHDALAAFTRMYNTASQLAAALQGEVCDARRQPVTMRGVESMRAEILEYQRRQWGDAAR